MEESSKDNDEAPICVEEESSNRKLQKHYAKYDISLDALLDKGNEASTGCLLPHRFVRLHPAFDANETLQKLKEELATAENSQQYPAAVPWLDPVFGFHALPGDFALAQSPCFQSGRIYGQDASSGAAVAALLTDLHDAACSRNENNREMIMTKEPRQQYGSEDDDAPAVPKHPSSWRVLDLCCAPGLKLCAIADWLRGQQQLKQQQESNASSTTCSGAATGKDDSGDAMVVGVDCSERRLATCRKIVQKFQIEPFIADSASSLFDEFQDEKKSGNVRIRLYQSDGTKFLRQQQETPNLVFDSIVATEERVRLGKRQRLNKSARARQKRRLQEIAAQDHPTVSESVEGNDDVSNDALLFDRVLVDAECSTDGSIKHVVKQIAKQAAKQERASASSSSRGNEKIAKSNSEKKKNEEELKIPTLTDSQRLANLVQLQRDLAESGFCCLKKNGFMVYSTCSFSEEQNEGVVQWLLDQYPSQSLLVPLVFANTTTTGDSYEDSSAVRLSAGGGDDGNRTGLVRRGSRLPGTIRFLPTLVKASRGGDIAETHQQSGGGGFFLAKIQKVA